MARAPMPAPQMIETPAMRRSAMLAQMLEQQRQPTQITGGYGELAARLLGQGITQFNANRAERKVKEEGAERMGSQRAALLAGLPPLPSAAPAPGAALGAALSPPPVANTQVPQESPIAPAAPIQGAPLPPQGAMPPAPAPMAVPSPMPAPPQAAPAANPLGPTPQEIALIRQAAESGDPGQLAWAQQTWGEIQMRMATPPEIDIAVGPDGTPYNTNDPSALNQRFRNVRDVRGVMMDFNDPNNVGAFIPETSPGEGLVRDAAGNITGINNMPGAIQARGERGRADADARNASEASYRGAIVGAEEAARAPYAIETVEGPDGRPIAMSREALLSGGGIVGQSPADAIRAEGAARNEVGADETARVRASAAVRALPQLANMEALLPDVIAGYGAGPRLAAARALAAAGDQNAIRQVAATQTFQNEARQLVAAILPSFGTNPTEGERKYAEQMSGADVTYSPETLREGIRLARERQARDPVRIQSREEFEALPSGAVFIAPDGTRRRKP